MKCKETSYAVNTVNEAISRRKKIRFQYTEFGPDLGARRGRGEDENDDGGVY